MAKFTARQFIVQYWIHISVLIFLVGFAIRQTLIYFAAADNCFTQEQWTTMSQDHGHCYVVYQRNGIPEVWEPPKDRSRWTHKDKPICGTDVTSVIPANHLANPNKFLNVGARYVGTIGSCAQPTATPEPTPIPSHTPLPTPTAANSNPTTTPLPTHTLSPTATLAPGAPTPTPTPTTIPTPSATLRPGQPTPTITSTPTTSAPVNSALTASPTFAPVANEDISSAPISSPVPSPTIITIAKLEPTPSPVPVLILASQYTADATVALALGVMALAIYLKLKSRKPKATVPKGEIYQVKISRTDAEGTWVDLVNASQQLEGWYALPGACPEGQCRVEGILKVYPPNTSYLEITSITPFKK